MQKILVSLPDDLATRMRWVIPSKKRSQVIASVLSLEIEKRERELYKVACEVENDSVLNQEMEEWNGTSGDGVANETW